MSYLLKQGQTTQPLVFLMIDSTDHLTGKTGLSPTVTISKNGGAFSSPLGTVNPIGSGWYKVDGNAIDSGTLGPLLLHATATGADPVDIAFHVVSFDPLTTNLGLSNVGANVAQWAGTNVATPNTAGVPMVDIAYVSGETAKSYDGTAQAGTTTTITLDTTEAAVAGALIGRQITIAKGTGVGQSRIITAYAGTTTKVATVHRAWDVTPDTTSNYIFGNTAEIADKDGYRLDATGLDAISVADPGSPASQDTLSKKVVGIWRSIFGKSSLDDNYLKMYDADGTTVISTQAMSDDGVTQTRGEAS